MCRPQDLMTVANNFFVITRIKETCELFLIKIKSKLIEPISIRFETRLLSCQTYFFLLILWLLIPFRRDKVGMEQYGTQLLRYSVDEDLSWNVYPGTFRSSKCLMHPDNEYSTIT